MATTIDIAKKYKKTQAEVAAALKAINFTKRVGVATKIESSVEQQLDAYWREQSTAKAKVKEEAPKPQRHRTIGQTEVSERPRRTINRPAPPKPPPPPPRPATPPTPEVAAKPAAKPEAKPAPKPETKTAAPVPVPTPTPQPPVAKPAPVPTPIVAEQPAAEKAKP